LATTEPMRTTRPARAFIIGRATGGEDYESMIRAHYPDQNLTLINEDPTVFSLEEEGNYVIIAEGQGYGGPFVAGVRIMKDARIHEFTVLEDKETPAFLKRIQDARYIDQFIGKNVADDFIVGQDVDAVSGATVSTMAATEAVRRTAHTAAASYFKLEADWQRVPWGLGLGEVLVLALFVLAFFKKIHGRKPWKYIYMAATVAIVGFGLNAAISVGSLSGLMMGYIPGLRNHLIWWTLTVGTVAAVILLGRNVYCYRICPFYGVQFVLSKVGGVGLSLPPRLRRRTGDIANFFLWLALMIIFLSSHPALGAYEPFAMMFSLQGAGVQWFILPAALIGALLFPNFWCRFFCPAGNTLSTMLKLRKQTVSLFKKGRQAGEDTA
jgi:uncharacterized protein with FMN-binding domain